MPIATPITNIVFFGDSIADSGNLFALTTELLTVPFPLASFGYSPAITNGRNFTQVTPDLLGIETQNFAIGGARAVGARTLGEAVEPSVADAFLADDADLTLLDIDINLGGQVGRFLASLGGQAAAPGTAASIFIGLNDFNNFVPQDPANIVAEATALAGAVA